MAIPLIPYAPFTQNARVNGYELPDEEQPKIYTTDNLLDSGYIDELIWAGYRQIFGEHQILQSSRQKNLESILRNGQITVREFIRGLVTSDVFLRLNYETNTNYRFVEICVQRLLGRDIFGEHEKIAWSIVIASKGVNTFISDLLDSEEYLNNFGDDIVPYQRRRVLPKRAEGETPFNLKTPRYDAYHRDRLGFPQMVWQSEIRRFKKEKITKGGNPASFLGMAREIAPEAGSPPAGIAGIDYMSLVPKR